MTYTLRAESPRRVAARKVAALMRRTMAARGVSTRGLAITLGTGRSLVQYWKAGESLPSLASAAKLADALMEPRLLALVQDSRLVACDVCQTRFEDRGGKASVYCSVRCRRDAQKIRDAIGPKRHTIQRRLLLHSDAVAGMCAACEPDGLCRTPECPLRAVSPLPLMAMPAVDVAPRAQQGPLTADGLRRKVLATTSYWAGLSPTERAAHVSRITEGRWGRRNIEPGAGGELAAP